MATHKKSNKNLHPTNKHNADYKFSDLIVAFPSLEEFVFVNNYGTETIDFSNPKAVKAINTALLFKYYNITFWDFPDDNLCPPIPGRVDYIHHLNDLLKDSDIAINANIIDIGIGANCIYPLLGNAEYNWQFVGTDIDKKSIDRAEKIIKKNNLTEFIQLKQQTDATNIFKGILNESDTFSATICNPPFY
ncbi:MAG: RlmF-related methyltransferase, partial [Bacteroidetes bacterium]|nr:RlmF-related methyltransferase [Bacteroidota bacterium]